MEKRHIIALPAALSLLEAILIFAGLLPPMFSYSPGNIVFSVLRISIIFYIGWIWASEGLKKNAVSGAYAMAGSVIIIFLAAIIGIYLGKPVLGIPGQNILSLLLIMIVNLLLNCALAAFIAALAAWISVRKISRRAAKS